MYKHAIALLGIPFDSIDLDEAAHKALALINKHANDGICRYVSTVNVDFLVHVYSVNWQEVLNPELLNIYRQSQCVVCDGMPLAWLSRWLGSPIKARIAGVDLIPHLVGVLAQHHKTIYLLGSHVQINKATGVILESLYPGIRIVGHSSPFIDTEGGNLLHASEQDDLIVEEINRMAPDLLFIALGNPKQEKWFERVRDKLKVPLSVGVGGSFDLISGVMSRAPQWMQTAGLEWLYRLSQEPARLWKRYSVDIVKFICMALPLIICHTNSRLLYWFRTTKNKPIEKPLLFLSDTQTIAIVPLPSLIDLHYSQRMHSELEEAFNQDTVVLDFAEVRHVTLEGFALLIKIWLNAQKIGKELYAFNLSGDLVLLFKVHRVWDLIKDSLAESTEQILRSLIKERSHPVYFDSIEQYTDEVVIYFFGKIGKAQNTDAYVERLEPIIKEKNCILDFRYCNDIQNAGFSFLLKLKKISDQHNKQLTVRKRCYVVKHLFKINEVEPFFAESTF